MIDSPKVKKKSAQQDDARHICALDNETANPFQVQTCLGAFSTCTEISAQHPSAKYYFRSLAAIEKERKRHRGIKHGYMIIHPLSIFRIYWDLSQLIVMYVGLMVIPLNFIYGRIVDSNQICYGLSPLAEDFEIVTDVLFFVDFIVTFFTGHCNYSKKEVVLHFGPIARLYLASIGFYIDLLCSISLIGITKVVFGDTLTVSHLTWYVYVKPLGAIKILRLGRFLEYLGRVRELLRQYYYVRIAIWCTLFIVLALHWLTCIYTMFVQTASFYSNPTDSIVRSFHYEMFVMADYLSLYLNSQYIVVSYLLCISLVDEHRFFYSERTYTPIEVSILVIYSTFGFIFSNLLLILIMEMILTMQASEMKYHSIMSQLSKYMFYNDLPATMRDRIICFYNYHFQKKYFRETTIMEILSHSLVNEINLFSCRSVIETVSLLRDLPPEVISKVVFYLKHQVFLYNDVIVKAGTIGDCMFFISNGTVAVSTPTGREICHLQDGAYFGEIALIAPDQKRIANVVAIEICEVFRLDRVHFRRCFDVNSAFFKKLEQIAEERIEKTVLLEELHRKYMLDRTTKRQNNPKDGLEMKV